MINIIVYDKTCYLLLDFISVSNPNYVFDIAKHQRDKSGTKCKWQIKNYVSKKCVHQKGYYKKEEKVKCNIGTFEGLVQM